MSDHDLLCCWVQLEYCLGGWGVGMLFGWGCVGSRELGGTYCFCSILSAVVHIVRSASFRTLAIDNLIVLAKMVLLSLFLQNRASDFDDFCTDVRDSCISGG